MELATYDAAVLDEAWRRVVQAPFVRQGWLEADAAASMLAWPHSGFSAHAGPAIAATDRAAALRVARHGVRAPVAESRLRYDAERAEVEPASDASEDPYVGVHRFAADLGRRRSGRSGLAGALPRVGREVERPAAATRSGGTLARPRKGSPIHRPP